ncbi:hypothetical protein J7E73_01290 [Paenibacillus albidus]|uniref:hypothetical protein n=1 Tax=Paenibacillus albidus TaxID=2041023 RepID=UPI001BECE60F|nr:hypothetical protein [Paenibacillus albidus]MBT2287778.1 hypothetical protein [Paenibacillus albidus]
MNGNRTSAGSKRRIGGLILAASIVCCSCGPMNDRPAQENLALALAGMTGSDGVTFEGGAVLLQGGKAFPGSTIYYGGHVMDHKKVSLFTLLPDERSSPAAAGTKALKQQQTTAPAYYSQLEKREGKWQPLDNKTSAGENNPLPALNPLRQLEELERMDKKVSEETGAANGTRVLRIELTAAQAHEQLAAELEQEMQALRPERGLSDAGAAAGRKQQAAEAMVALWEKRNSEMKLRLEQAEIKTVYHLTVDTRHSLPKRLAWTRVVSYPEAANRSADETYVMQVSFYGYR